MLDPKAVEENVVIVLGGISPIVDEFESKIRPLAGIYHSFFLSGSPAVGVKCFGMLHWGFTLPRRRA
jgi:hypothetical protein